ncbi:MAG: O-antigen ligase family protein, partial [Gammaproteobacteria bacterium]|nr:O-antigen ligase family protein [Gammaproteobacteria bacterium]
SAFHFGTRIYRWLLIAMFIALGLAVLQTWVLGNPFGVGEGRFTGFTASQTFGLFLGLLAPLLIANGQTARPAFAIPLVVAALIGAVMLFNGSRTGLLLLIFLSGFAFLGWFRSTGNTNRVVGFAAVAATLMVVSALSVGVMRHGPEKEAVSRATEGLLLVTGQRSYKDIGTLRWRLGMYAAIGLRQAQSSPLEWVVGHGMSDVADIVASGGYFLRGYDYDTVDANRIAHNEWLRSIYEFGIIGLSLLIALYAYILWLALRVARRIRTAETGVLLGLVFAIFVLLSTQNVFAASVAPHGFVITLVVARLLALSVQHELLTNVRGVLQQDRVHAVLDGQQPA